VRQPFNVNAMAQAAAMAALDDEEHLERTCAMTEAGRRFFAGALSEIGVETTPSAANFVMAKTGRSREVFEAMQRRKAIVRPLHPYGLSEHVRITVGPPERNRFVLEALREVLSELGGPPA